jgi:formate dehydrogenase major subunit
MAVKEIKTTCAYCGAGCQLLFAVDREANKILGARPAGGRTNDGTACLKGWYGWDYLNDPQILTKRLTKPLIRKGGKGAALVEVGWDEAVSYTAGRLKEIKQKYGPNAIMGTGSARGPGNEANYVMQKFIRATVGTNNVDHCARI